jgi:hypothetical protein
MLFIILDLSRDDVLVQPARKKILLHRTSRLAELTLTLTLSYASISQTNQFWLKQHFKQMEAYIRERERWILAPIDTTLDNLRNDFYALAPIFIIGNYGTFQWKYEISPPKSSKIGWKGALFRNLARVLGIILPLTLMGLYLWQPSLFPFLQIDPNIVALIFVAWLLLTLDITLKLGVVAELTNLAKGIKDLA